MAKKHLFISIGSTSAAALTTLLDRLIDLGIYKPLDPHYEDRFVAIDTDEAPLQKVLSYNQGETAHTFAIRFIKSGAPNVFSHNFLKDSYRFDWRGDTLKILAAQKGVGGRRVKSFGTLEWRDSLKNIIFSFFGKAQGATLLNDYQVVLVSTSWGGTASGMFQNVADFIGEQIYECCGGNEHLTPFYTVLALPNYEAAKAIRDKNDYQALENFAYFMRSIQQAGWRGTLGRLRSSKQENLQFVFPEFCDLNSNGEKITVNPIDGEKPFCGTDSTLPQRAIIAVPTMSSTTTAETLAEQLLLLGYLNVLEHGIDFSKTVTADGKFVDIRKAWSTDPTKDCPVLIGFNMVECQYPREAVIVRTIEQEMVNNWRRFYSNEKSTDMNVATLVDAFIKSCIAVPETSNKNVQNVLAKLDGDWPDSTERIAKLKDAVSEFVEKVEHEAYIFPRYEDANELLARFAEFGKNLKDQLRKEAFDKSVTLRDIRDAYIRQLDKWHKKSSTSPDAFKNKICKMIDYSAKQYSNLQKGKGFDNYIINYCNGNTQVRNEFLAIAREAIKTELLELQDVMLTRAISTQWRLTAANEVSNGPSWSLVNDMMADIANKISNVNGGSVNGFIKTVHNNALADALKNGLVNVNTIHCIELLKKSAQKAELQGCYEGLRNILKLETIADMDRRKLIGVANTDMITLHDAKLSGCCPSFHEEKSSASSFHFYVKNTGATDITWQDVASMGFDSFVNAKNTDISMVTNVDKKHVDFDAAGMGIWFEDNITYNSNSLYGMWLGSADIGLTFRKVLDKIYNKQDLRDIQSAADKLERDSTQQHKQCHQTLFEKVAIGAVLGMIAKKVKNVKLNIGENLTLTLKTLAGEQVWSKTTGNVDDLGLSSDGSGMSMKSVSAEFIKNLMSWTQDTNGTCKFAQAFDCEELYSKLLNQECFVLTDMRLTPTEDQAKEIIAFCDKLEDCITVSVN